MSGASAAVLLALLSVLPVSSRAQDEDIRVQRHLHYLYLGDSLQDIQRIYVPAQEWPSYREPRTRVNRIRVERSFLKQPDRDVEQMWLGMKSDRLVELQLVYDSRSTRRRSVDQLVKDLSLIYGEPEGEDGKYWWTDGKTVMRVFYAEVPVNNEDGSRGVELRTSLQLAESWLFAKRR